MALGLTPYQIIEKGIHPLLVIADEWERVQLKNIATVQNGFAFSSKLFSRTEGLPLIRIRDIFSSETENLYTGEYSEDYIVAHGDFLIGMDGDFKISKWPGKRGLLNQRVCRVHFNSSYYERNFLFICIQPYLNAINSETSAVTVKHLSSKTINDIPLPLPPLPEQRAIVAKIEELFSDLDKGVADLKKAQDQLKVYRQAILKKAFEGELTKEWREQQTELPTAAELLDQIKEDFELLVKEKKKKKEKPLIKIKSEDIPHAIPNNWSWCNLGEVAWFVNGDRGKNYPNKSEYVPTGIPWINTGHIEPDGSLSAERMNFITQAKFDSLRSGKIQPGDLVYCLRGATFGKTAYVDPYTEGSIASSLMIIRTNEKINKVYLYHFLTSVEGKKQLQRFDNGTAQPNLSANMVRSFAFPLPSLEEQHQIAQEIESRLSVCNKVEESISESLDKSKALRQSILKKAFEGNLLSTQEIEKCKAAPDYEPAAVLLEKIKNL